MWKNLSSDVKEGFYSAARTADREHKIKYPGYYYSPKEARLRKGLKLRKLLPTNTKNAIEGFRFVKVFMANNEKTCLVSQEQTSLLKKSHSPSTTVEPETMETDVQSSLEAELPPSLEKDAIQLDGTSGGLPSSSAVDEIIDSDAVQVKQMPT